MDPGDNKITAIILAGGAGRRMDNQDKAWLEYHNKPLIDHVLGVIRPQVDRLVISYSRNPSLYQSLPYPAQVDLDPDFKGPLIGILSCKTLIRTEFTLVVPCDMPNLPGDLVIRLRQALGEHDIALPHDGTRNQHLVFLTRPQVLDSITNYIKSGQTSVEGWVGGQKYRVVDFSGEPDAFVNINTIAQLSS